MGVLLEVHWQQKLTTFSEVIQYQHIFFIGLFFWIDSFNFDSAKFSTIDFFFYLNFGILVNNKET